MTALAVKEARMMWHLEKQQKKLRYMIEAVEISSYFYPVVHFHHGGRFIYYF
jgi:hypothetical protein